MNKCILISVYIIFALSCISIGSAQLMSSDFEKCDDVYSYSELTELLQQIQSDHPEIFNFSSIGKTYEGRDIWLVKISDNVSIDEDEPEILITGGMHGNEKQGYQVVIFTIKSLIENYSYFNVNQSFTNRIRNITNNTELFFIPMVNPDGISANIRKNKEPNNCIFGKTLFRGVDLNRNFDYNWEEFTRHPLRYLTTPRSNVMFPFFDFSSFYGDGVYRGPYPFSENETKALKKFVETHNIYTGIDYHSAANKNTYPWAWTDEPPEDKALFESIAENFSRINEYDVIQWSEFYHICGFFSDWMYGEHNIIHFTIELAQIEGERTRYSESVQSISEICETHFYVNLYLAERSLTLNS